MLLCLGRVLHLHSIFLWVPDVQCAWQVLLQCVSPMCRHITPNSASQSLWVVRARSRGGHDGRGVSLGWFVRRCKQTACGTQHCFDTHAHGRGWASVQQPGWLHLRTGRLGPMRLKWSLSHFLEAVSSTVVTDGTSAPSSNASSSSHILSMNFALCTSNDFLRWQPGWLISGLGMGSSEVVGEPPVASGQRLRQLDPVGRRWNWEPDHQQRVSQNLASGSMSGNITHLLALSATSGKPCMAQSCREPGSFAGAFGSVSKFGVVRIAHITGVRSEAAPLPHHRVGTVAPLTDDHRGEVRMPRCPRRQRSPQGGMSPIWETPFTGCAHGAHPCPSVSRGWAPQWGTTPNCGTWASASPPSTNGRSRFWHRGCRWTTVPERSKSNQIFSARWHWRECVSRHILERIRLQEMDSERWRRKSKRAANYVPLQMTLCGLWSDEVTDLLSTQQRTYQMIVPMTRSLVIFTFEISKRLFIGWSWAWACVDPSFLFSTVLVGSQSTARDCVKALFSLTVQTSTTRSSGHNFCRARVDTLFRPCNGTHTFALICHWVFKSFRRATHDIKSLSLSRLQVKCMSLLIAVFLCCAVLFGTTHPSWTLFFWSRRKQSIHKSA